MSSKTVFIKTFGCQMNERDSEIMLQSLGSCGYLEGSAMEEADLVILNTCSIRAKAEQKVMSLLGHLRKLKARKPGMKICVAGCVAQQEGEKLVSRMEHIDLVLGTQQIYNICTYLKEKERTGRGPMVVTAMSDRYDIPSFLPEKTDNGPENIDQEQSRFSRFVTIMQGCNNFCTYCVVPFTRGRESSRKVEDILEECRVLVSQGIREIVLLGQNVNSYGMTNRVTESSDRYRFPDLLREVSEISGLERLRFTTSNPKDLDGRLIECFGTLENLCPQFHLPVQSGSNRILAAMNRKYTVEQYLEKIDKLLEVCPQLAITTDVIVGFPGETDKDFEATMRLLDEVRFHGSFSFKYSDRPGTVASTLENKVPEEIKTERLARFQARQDEISLQRNREYLGAEKRILIEVASDTSIRGRTDTNHIVHFEDRFDALPGSFVQGKITHAGQHSLRGRIADRGSTEGGGESRK